MTELTRPAVTQRLQEIYTARLQPLWWEDREDDQLVLYSLLSSVISELSSYTFSIAALDPRNTSFTAEQNSQALMIYDLFVELSPALIQQQPFTSETEWIRAAATTELDTILAIPAEELFSRFGVWNYITYINTNDYN